MQASWSSEMILLGLLCERPMLGYELSQLVRDDPAMPVIWRFERSEVYFLLGKLRERGCVAERGAVKGGGPTLTVYAPTEEARRALDDWLRIPEVRPRVRFMGRRALPSVRSRACAIVLRSLFFSSGSGIVCGMNECRIGMPPTAQCSGKRGRTIWSA